jgi:hypothetical protein
MKLAFDYFVSFADMEAAVALAAVMLFEETYWQI